MPRASTKTEDEKVEKKTPRKRAAPKKTTAAKATASKAAPKKTTAKKTTAKKAPVKRRSPAKSKTTVRKSAAAAGEQSVEEELDTGLEEEAETKELAATIKKRKAPTVFSSEAAKKRALKTQVIVIGVLLIMGVGASAAVGFNDSTAGQINVEETIKAQNAKMANMVDVDGPTVVAPTPNRATIPDNGLIPSADQTKKAPVQALVPSSSSTATSTLSTDLSTDDGEQSEPAIDRTTGASAMDTATTTVTATNQETENDPVSESDQSSESQVVQSAI